ncbi:MAG TPA: right-handed parallel beta-helix repeat-containing protein, partial [candidate division Zixibacteria bacterium]|nr:right-handed parallel beta-helix repeat-containing protein [candidate division Zixibacteria bacterium]
MTKTLRIVFLLTQLAVCAGATNYYVSSTGSNSAAGLTPATAWLSIDNGDQSQLSVLMPGDTVNILPGTYVVSNTITLSSSGSPGSRIVYQKLGRGKVIVDLNNADKVAFYISASYSELHGIEITNSRKNGISLYGHFDIIADCFINGVGKIGIDNYATNNLLLRNVIYATGDDGIKTENGGGSNLLYNNVIHATGNHGIELTAAVIDERIFNNIVTSNKNRGISGSSQDVCGFNNVWGNPGGDYVGITDSAGGISVFPKFVDTAQGRFDLKAGADEIDAGLDLGYDFNGAAPDIGAFEKYNVYYVSPTGDDSASGKSVVLAWRSIDNGDSLLLPGDSVHVLPGTYTDSVVITDSGIADNDRIIFHGARDSVTIDASSSSIGVDLSGDYLSWVSISIDGATNTDMYISGSNGSVSYSRFTQAGTYGIHATQPTDLIKNVLAFNNHTGVFEESSQGASILNNSFYNNQYYGFKTNSGLLTLANDIFQGHDSAGVHAPLLNTVAYSLFFGNSSNVSGGVLLGLTSQTKNPQFVNPGGGSFFLSQGSPGIDGGANVGLPYSGSAPDIGAYESGVLTQLIITPTIDTLSADSTYQFSVTALDSAGLPANPGSLVWSTTFASGTISPTGLFTPDLVGDGTVMVKSSISAIKDTSIVMHVAAGAISSFAISPNSDTVSADSAVQFTALGSDANGNSVTDFGTLTWSVLNNIGTIDATGLFTPSNSGKGFIRVLSDLGPSSISDTITVLPGAISYIEVF